MRALDEVVRSGKVLHIGISDAPAWEVSYANTLAKFHGWSQFVAYQGKYSLSCREAENDILPMCEKFNIGYVPWAVLGQGKLTGKHKKEEKSKETTRNVQMTDLDFQIQDEVVKIAEEINVTPSQVAVNWMLNRKQIGSCLVGPRTYEQFVDNMKALDFQLTKEHIEKLDTVSNESVKGIFPHTMIGKSYKNNQWLYFGSDTKYTIE